MKQLNRNMKYLLLVSGAIIILLFASQFFLPAQQIIIQDKNQSFGCDYLYPYPVVDVDLIQSGDETHIINISINISPDENDPIDHIVVYFDDYLVREVDVIDNTQSFLIDFQRIITATDFPENFTANDEWYEHHRIITFVYSPSNVESFIQYEFRVRYTIWEEYEGPLSLEPDIEETSELPEMIATSSAISSEIVIIIIAVGIGLIGLFILNYSNRSKLRSNKK